MGDPIFDQETPDVCSVWGEREMAAFDRAVIDNSQNAVVACDQYGNLVVFNPTAREWHGVDARVISAEERASYYGLYLPDGTTPFPSDETPLARAFRGETIRNIPLVIRAEGQLPRQVACGGGPFFDEAGGKLGAFVVMVDTTEMHQMTKELEHLASHDVLTGLPNRRTFEAEVERAMRFADRGVTSTVLFADVDRFKTCNDRFGHEFGDRVLSSIAQRMKSVIRDVDTVARIGGDEFGVVLWGQSGYAVQLVSTRLSEAVAAEGREYDLDIGLSIGSSIVTSESDASSVLAEADSRMYQAKASPEHGSSFADPEGAARRDAVCSLAGGELRRSSIDAKALSYAKLRLQTLISTDDLESMLQSMLDEICGITGSKIGFYHFVSADQQFVSLKAWSTRTAAEFCAVDGHETRYPIADAGVWADCVRERIPVMHNNYAALPHRKGLPEGHAPVVRELVVPIMRGGLVVAVLGVGNKPTDYQPEDMDAVTLLADVTWDITERRLAQERVIESERRLEAVIESAPFGAHMYELTDDDRLIFVGYNRMAEEMLGIEHAPLLGLTLEEAFPGNVGTEIPGQYRRAAREQTTWESEEFAYDANGVSGIFEILVFPFGADRTAVFFRDVTEKRKLEIALEEGDVRYKRLIKNMSEGFAYCRLVLDDEGRPVDWVFLDANDSIESSRSADEITGKRALEIWPSIRESGHEFFDCCCRVGMTGQSENLDIQVAPDMWVHYSVTSPEKNHFVVVGADVSARMAAEHGLARTTRALRALSGVNEVLVHAETEEQLLSSVCDAIVNEAGYVLAWVGYAQHDEGKTVLPIRYCGADSDYLDAVRITWGEGRLGRGPTGRSIRERRPVVMHEMQTDPDFEPWREEAAKRGFEASVSLPLVEQDGSVFGALVLYSRDRDAFDGEEMRLLSEMAGDLAYGIETLRARVRHAATGDDLVRTNERLERILKSITATMGKVVETRDPYTQGHELGVAKISREIARELGLPQDEVEGIEVASLVHDVGKLAVPTEILTKPGRLTQIEFELIKSHSQAGYDILRDIDFDWPVAEIVLQHHERMDGSGYPSGLRGEDISMAARILMVADVIEAMAAHRPYRPALGLDAAMAEIVGHPEKFDPQVVAACVRLHAAGRIEL